MNPADAVLALGISVAVVAWLVLRLSPWHRRRRERRALEQARRQEAAERALAQQWMEAVAYSQSYARREQFLQVGLAHVIMIYGAYPRRGTKAMICWYGGNGAAQDTWFELAWPRVGDWLVIAGGEGYGPHNHNPETFYAHILRVLPAGAWEAWQRQVLAGQLPAVAHQLVQGGDRP